MKLESNELKTDNGSIFFTISDEVVERKREGNLYFQYLSLSDKPKEDHYYIECETSISRFFYIILYGKSLNFNYENKNIIYHRGHYPTENCYDTYRTDYYKYHNLSCKRALLLLEKSTKKYHKDSFSIIKKLASDIYELGKNITNSLSKSIDDVFTLDNIGYKELYDKHELKWKQRKEGSFALVQQVSWIIDQNTKFFLKNNRVYSGLAFIREIISYFNFGFWSNFYCSPPVENPLVKMDLIYTKGEQIYFNRQDTKVEVTYYLSQIIWRYNDTIISDNELSIILNKIIENLFILLAETNHPKLIAELYKNLQKTKIFNLKSDTLVCVIDALLKYNEKELIETAIAELKKTEPRHPIIEIANKALRRIQVLNQVSEAFNINISDIQKLSGIEFELFLENQFNKNGFKVERTKGSGDFGADLIVETTSGTRASIQAKRYKQKANLKAVQEVVASLAHYQTDFGIVITTSGYFQSAVDLAQTNNVELWDEDKLIQFLSGDFSFSMLNES